VILNAGDEPALRFPVTAPAPAGWVRDYVIASHGWVKDSDFIGSRYVLRIRGRHLSNPSNFGICLMLFLAAASVAGLSIQWGNNLAAVAGQP